MTTKHPPIPEGWRIVASGPIMEGDMCCHVEGDKFKLTSGNNGISISIYTSYIFIRKFEEKIWLNPWD